ncbi:hypothetical protein HK098_004872 [Nowakowskiella sp. JEL0407]|nr:hypothetical protein HK098_004872 [Nowakowskiella sp. JEL0407]
MPTTDEYLPSRPMIPTSSIQGSGGGRKDKGPISRDIPLPRIPGYVYQPPAAEYITAPSTPRAKGIAHERFKTHLNIVSVFRALLDGKLPTNDQMLTGIDQFLNSDSVATRRTNLSVEGQMVLADFEALIETIARVLVEKNSDMNIQKFIHHSRIAAMNATSEIKQTSGPPVDTAETLKKGMTLMRLLVTNEEFRETFFSLIDLFQDMAGAYATEGGGYLQERPLTKILRAASDSSKKSSKKKAGKSTESSEYQTDDDTSDWPTEYPKKEKIIERNTGLKVQIPRRRSADYGEIPSINVQSAGSEASDVTRFGKFIGESADDVSRRLSTSSSVSFNEREEHFPAPLGTIYENEDESETRFGRKDTTTTTASTVKDEDIERLKAGQEKILQSVRGRKEEGYKKQGRETTATGGVFGRIKSIADNHWTDEKKEEMADRLKQIMMQLQKNEDYQDAIEYFISLGERIRRYFISEVTAVHGSKSRAQARTNFQLAADELKIIFSNFAGGKSVEPLLGALRVFYENFSKDRRLHHLMTDVKLFLLQSLRDPNFLERADYRDDAQTLMNRSKDILNEKYQTETSDVVNEFQTLITAFRSDRLTRKLAADSSAVTKGLFMNSLVLNFFSLHFAYYLLRRGQPTIKTSLLNDVANVGIPLLFEQIKYIPIPRIEHRDENLHLIFDDVVLTSENTIPNLLEMKLEHTTVVGLRKVLPSVMGTSVRLGLYQIHCDIRDVPFYIKKRGFPGVEDYGVLDLLVSGQGITVIADIGIDNYSSTQTLIPRIQCHIDQLQINPHHTQHDAIYKSLLPTINKIAKVQIARSLENALYDQVMQFDAMLTKYKRNSRLFAGKTAGQGLRQLGRYRRRGPMGILDATRDLVSRRKVKSRSKREQDEEAEAGAPGGSSRTRSAWMSNAFDI